MPGRVVSGARIVSGARVVRGGKKKRPPAKPVKGGGLCPLQPKSGGSGGQRPPAKKNDVTVTYRNRRLTKPYVPDIVNEDWM